MNQLHFVDFSVKEKDRKKQIFEINVTDTCRFFVEYEVKSLVTKFYKIIPFFLSQKVIDVSNQVEQLCKQKAAILKELQSMVKVEKDDKSNKQLVRIRFLFYYIIIK